MIHSFNREESVGQPVFLWKLFGKYFFFREVTIRGVIWEPTQSDQLKYINIGGFEVGDIKVEETCDLSGSKSFWQSFL